MDKDLAAFIAVSIVCYLKNKDIDANDEMLNRIKNKLMTGRYTDVFRYVDMKVKSKNKKLGIKEKPVKFIDMDRPSYLHCIRSSDTEFVEGEIYPIKYCVEKDIDDNYYITEYAVDTETGKEVTVPTFSPAYGFKIVIL